MNLLEAEEWTKGSFTVKGTDVFCSGSGKVSTQWLSSCREERALTKGMMEKVASPLTLAAALRQVVKNGGSPGVDGMDVKDFKAGLPAI